MSWSNKFGTKTFEEFMKALLLGFGAELQFFNKKAIYKLTEDKNAELILVTRGTSGQYEAIKVRIVNKNSGLISEEQFPFSEYLMEGYVGQDCHPYPKVIDHCGKDWYMDGATPKALTYFMEKLREYIRLYN